LAKGKTEEDLPPYMETAQGIFHDTEGS